MTRPKGSVRLLGALVLLLAVVITSSVPAEATEPVNNYAVFAYLKPTGANPCKDTEITGPLNMLANTKWVWQPSGLLQVTNVTNAPAITLDNFVTAASNAGALSISTHGGLFTDSTTTNRTQFAVEWYLDQGPALSAAAAYLIQQNWLTRDFSVSDFVKEDLVTHVWVLSLTPDGVTNHISLSNNALVVAGYCGSHNETANWSTKATSYLTGFSCSSCDAILEFWTRMTCGRYPCIANKTGPAVAGIPNSTQHECLPLADFTASNLDSYWMDGNQSLVLTDGVSCIKSDVSFGEAGAFGNHAYCSALGEVGIIKYVLRGFVGINDYPTAPDTLAIVPASENPGMLNRYETTFSGSYALYDWIAVDVSGLGIWSRAFEAGSEPDEWNLFLSTPEVLFTSNGDSLAALTPPVIQPDATPSDAACADIIVYSSSDALAEPVRAQIAADFPTLKVRKYVPPTVLICPSGQPCYNGPDKSAVTARNAIAAIRDANATWNASCGTGNQAACSRQYPVTPGPEVYLVGDTTYVNTAKFTPRLARCLLSQCRSDLAIYDLYGSGQPLGPLSRIPAANATQAQRAAASAHDVSFDQFTDPQKRVVFIAGDHYNAVGMVSTTIPALQTVVGKYQQMGYLSQGILKDTDYGNCGYVARWSAFRTLVNAGVREIFGYGLYSGVNIWPGHFVKNTVSDYSKKQRVIAWLPDCQIHDLWSGYITWYPFGGCAGGGDGLQDWTDIIAEKLMFNDPAMTTLAASVGQMDVGYDDSHRAMAKYLADQRVLAGQANASNRISVARVLYNAVIAAGTESPWLKDHAMSLSAWGSRVLLPSGGAGGGGCPVAETLTPSGWSYENTILERSETGTLAGDRLKLLNPASTSGGKYRFRLRENEQERTTLDAVGLAAIDRDPSVRTFRTAAGYLFGTRRAAARAWLASGEDVTSFVSGASDSGVVLDPGDTLYVDWANRVGAGTMSTTSTGGGFTVADDDSMFDMESMSKELPPEELSSGMGLEGTIDHRVLAGTGLQIQKEATAGNWTTVTQYYPRDRYEEAVTAGVGTGRLRIVAIGRHRIRFVGRVIPSQQSMVSPTILTPIAAQHTRIGNVRPAIANTGGQVTYLEPGDTLNLLFDVPTLPAGKVRDLFLVTRGVYTSMRPSGAGEASIVAAAPPKFGLGAARPNPSTGRTTIDYSLARQTVARMRIFNVAGRLVRTLVNGQQEAGPHEVVWDGRTDSGVSAGAGVYFYRLEAADWSSEKKLIVLQR